jgi:hypothetical protein
LAVASPIEEQLARWPEERLLWTGKPDPRVRFDRGDRFAIPVGIAVCAVVITWDTRKLGGASVSLVVVAAVINLIWLYLLVGRFFYKQFSRTRTTYAVTTGRAIVSGPGLTRDVPLREQTATSRLSRDRRHVTVAVPVSNGNAGPVTTGRRQTPPPLGFYDVENPDALLEALQQAGVVVRMSGT